MAEGFSLPAHLKVKLNLRGFGSTFSGNVCHAVTNPFIKNSFYKKHNAAVICFSNVTPGALRGRFFRESCCVGGGGGGDGFGQYCAKIII